MFADREIRTARLLNQMQRQHSMKRDLSSNSRKLPSFCDVFEQQYRYSMYTGGGGVPPPQI